VALFAVYQATCQLIGAGVNAAGIPPDRISFPAIGHHAAVAQLRALVCALGSGKTLMITA
jgi:hypothetical protein